MKVLFIGGTGTISTACSQMVVKKKFDLTLLNRGQTDRQVPEGTRILLADIRKPNHLPQAIHQETFDVVVNWINFVPEQVQFDIDLFKGRIGQYIFISSASAYQAPPSSLPVTESTPLDNSIWEYSENKIACKELLMRNYRNK